MSEIRNVIENCIPTRLSENILKISDKILQQVNEIRIKANKPIILVGCDTDFFISKGGYITECVEDGIKVLPNELLKILNMICNNSLYAYLDTLKNGFVTLKGGHRVGITGKVVIKDNRINNN